MTVERFCWWTATVQVRCCCGIVLAVLILLRGDALEAREVNRKEAEQIAAQWIRRENALPDQRVTGGPFRLAMTRELFEGGNLVGYVVDMEPSGFLIVPAFTELSPVKFASFAGHFEDLASHPFIKELRTRLAYTKTLLGYAQPSAVPMLQMQVVSQLADEDQIRANGRAWTALSTTRSKSSRVYAAEANTATFVTPLLKSSWDQGAPYNLQTPVVGGEHTWTGCVATAMAQVMYFWRYPSAGQGTHSYTWNGSVLTANFAHPYDWEHMKDIYTGGENDAERAAVATLMSDAGIAVDMGYGLSASGTRPENWEVALKSFFKYSSDTRNVFRRDYASWSDWFLVFKNQLDLARPALLGIDPRYGGEGHAVVVDGYRVQDGIHQIHVNMGWSGSADNYYAVDDIYGYGNASTDVATIDIHPSEHFVYTPTAPFGISVGKTDAAYEYQSEPSRDSDSDALEYSFDWGDGSSSPWSATMQASHAWPVPGTYAVTVRARSAARPEIISSPSPVKIMIIDNSLFGTERGALIDFYLCTDGDRWARNDNWKKPDGSFNDWGTEGNWYGVGGYNGHVTTISMIGNISRGFIPPSVGDLKFLQLLRMDSCGLSGEIPDSIGNLTNLNSLSLFNNKFEGAIPDEMGNLTNLSYLYLYGNRFIGSIPESLGKLKNLQLLNLGYNRLSGTIPSSIGNLGNLRQLNLIGNQLSGPISDRLGQLTNLTNLFLGLNNLSDTIPATLGNLTQLVDLSLETNQLSGLIPTELFRLVNLAGLWVSDNDLSGPLPSGIDKLINLKSLGLHGNQFSGSLPAALGNLTKLTYLDLGANNFSGSIPPELSNLADLTRLQLDANQITGAIPKELGNLHKLSQLYINDNQLSGSIPGELSGIAPNVDFYVQNNSLSGSIPKEIFNLTHMSYFYVHGNMLSGEIPAEVLNLGDLSILACGHPRINNNALHTSNSAVIDFLNARFQPGWDTTQTVAPQGLSVQALTATSVRLSWTPIAYQDGGGGYRIFSSLQPGGPWIEVGVTTNKRASSYVVGNLLPLARYSFFVRTQTDANESNKNTILSEPSAIVSILIVPAGGAVTTPAFATTDTLTPGYATVATNTGTTPFGTAVFSYMQNGVVVSEAGVPASPPTTAARFFVDTRRNVSAAGGMIQVLAGFAAVNPNNSTAILNLTLRNGSGDVLARGTLRLAPGAHIAKFLDQLAPDFLLPVGFIDDGFGSLDIASNPAVSLLAMRLTINQRGELLMSSTPVADLAIPAPAGVQFLPQIADGGGYQTTFILLNTSSAVETGAVQFYGNTGSPLLVGMVDGVVDSRFSYRIQPGGCLRLVTSSSPKNVSVGWAQIIPDASKSAPASATISGFSQGNALVTEAGFSAVAPTTHAKIYVDKSGGHDTGIAVANLESSGVRIIATAYQADGTTRVGGQGSVDLVSMGHAASFAGEVISGLPDGFTGVLDLSCSTPFAALTLRSLTNSRGEFLITTFPIADQNQAPPSPMIFPQIADGGGYRTQIILINTNGAALTVTVNLLWQ
jgi:Leucine-rich repeat (LRR) protein